MSILEQLRSATLSAAERRVADVIASEPESVAFETVAEIAKRSNTGGATVMRLAAKLGFDGFSQLQEAMRSELLKQLRPAAARVRLPVGDDPVARAIDVELANVLGTLTAVDVTALSTAAGLLLAAGRVVVLSGDAGAGVASSFAADLGMIRPDVSHVSASTVGLVRQLAHLNDDDVVVIVDVARYDVAIIETVHRLGNQKIIALTDSHFSAIGGAATCSFVAKVEGGGPFDSYVGLLALANLLVTSTVIAAGTERVASILDRLESTWTSTGALLTDAD
jgi:DNA-binding MurR/RpiR family transcriptional regulator